MARCSQCRFWSEMIARAYGGGPVEALCLVDGGPRFGKYTRGGETCSAWKSDYAGKVDDPPDYGESVREFYIGEEGPDALKARSGVVDGMEDQ